MTPRMSIQNMGFETPNTEPAGHPCLSCCLSNKCLNNYLGLPFNGTRVRLLKPCFPNADCEEDDGESEESEDDDDDDEDCGY